MDDLDELRESEFVTDTDDQDSLDERIDTEQSLRNQQLWASFQNAACCITKLYKDRAQPNVSLWVPFQNAASNLTTLYKDCIESQRRFAKIGYQIGRSKRRKSLKSIHKRHQSQARHQAQQRHVGHGEQHNDSMFGAQATSTPFGGQPSLHQSSTGVSSILAVNQLNLGCDQDLSPSHSMQAQMASNTLISQKQHQEPTLIAQEDFRQSSNHQNHNQTTTNTTTIQSASLLQNQSGAQPIPYNSNNEDNLVTFQQALVQPAVVRSIKSGQTNYNSNRSSYLPIDSTHKSEEDRLLELNRFLSEEYHRHVGSRKRSCSTHGGSMVKRVRE